MDQSGHASEKKLLKSGIDKADLAAKKQMSIIDDSIMAVTLSRCLLIVKNFVGLGSAETELGAET